MAGIKVFLSVQSALFSQLLPQNILCHETVPCRNCGQLVVMENVPLAPVIWGGLWSWLPLVALDHNMST